jgi:hypothetical protein
MRSTRRTSPPARPSGTGIAFDPRVANQILTFSSIADGRFTDAETGSIWTLLGQAVDGPLSGEQLQTVQHRNDFWFAWASFFPDAPAHGGQFWPADLVAAGPGAFPKAAGRAAASASKCCGENG